MTVQLNLRVSEELLSSAKKCAQVQGYLNIQEYIREAVREKVEEDLQVRPEYLKFLQSKEANTFLNKSEQEVFEKELQERIVNEKGKIQQIISKKTSKVKRSRAH